MRRFNPWFIISTLLLQVLFLAIINMELCIETSISHLRSFIVFANIILIILGLFSVVAIKSILTNYRQQIQNNLLKLHNRDTEHLLSIIHEEKSKTIRNFETINSLLQVNQINRAADFVGQITNLLLRAEESIPAEHRLLGSLLSSRQEVARAHNIQFGVKIDLNPDIIPVEAWDLCTIIGNLLDNALDASLMHPGSRQVGLKICREDNWYIISVSNSGPRIKPGQKARLFEPGYTTQGSAARGFGLFIVRRLVDQHGGAIDVISDKITTFTIYIPDEEAVRNDKRDISATGA